MYPATGVLPMAETVEPQPKPTTTATKNISVAKALQDIGQKNFLDN